MKKKDIDKLLKPGAVIPVSIDSVQLLVNHIKDLKAKYEDKPDILFQTNAKWNFGWQLIDICSSKFKNLELIFDGETGELKDAKVLNRSHE